MRNIVQWIKRARLRDWLRLIDRVIPHIAIVISGMLVVFFLIDRVNKPMAFMTNEFHKRITFALALMSIYLAIRRCAYLRAKEREDMARRARSRPAQQAPSRRTTEARPVSRSASTTARRVQRDYEPRYGERR